MNRNLIIVSLIVIALISIAAFTIYNNFEIQRVVRAIPPTREARANEYLALDRWLTGMGIPVRVKNSSSLLDILEARERNIFIQSSLFTWTKEASTYLFHWVETGGTLYLVLDNFQGATDSGLLDFLLEFGINAERSGRITYYDDYEYPDYDLRVFFSVNDNNTLTFRDRGNIVRLVQRRSGAGTIIVSGNPQFLLSRNLDNPANSRLAWALFADRATRLGGSDSGAWLFIRGIPVSQGLWGSLFRQGNFTALIVSVSVLLLIGFWAVIPNFGLLSGDDTKPGKTLRERFLSEGRFLRNYRALDVYKNAYLKEIKRKLFLKEGYMDDDEFQRRLTELIARPIDERNFLMIIKNYKEVLERI
ncbi:MAG: hypothetical protein FWG77_02660 [Treponema sp.]|nr:hypothetical protein [Treponema sp.]